jgi:antitoxin CcdA
LAFASGQRVHIQPADPARAADLLRARCPCRRAPEHRDELAPAGRRAPLPTQFVRINLAHELEATAMISDRPTKKRAVNLFVDAELLDHARRMRINISETLERRLRSLVRTELEKQWLQDNQEAIAQYNRRVAEYGLLSDDAGLL